MVYLLAPLAALALYAVVLYLSKRRRQHCPSCGAVIEAKSLAPLFSRQPAWMDDWKCASCGASWKDAP